MLAFRACLIILIAYFNKNIDGSHCNVANPTFSFARGEACKWPTPRVFGSELECFPTVVDGCFAENNLIRLIIHSNVTILREGTFRNLPKLSDIFMNNTGIEEIEPEAFHNIPEASELNLARNKLRVIRSGVFSGTMFNMIDLTSNQINTVEDYAFANMPDLGYLNMGGNRIEELKENWFSNSPIRDIVLARNKLAVIKLETLSKLKQLFILDVSFNQIYSIDLHPTLTTKLSSINLTGNNLTNLDFLSGFRLKYLHVALNNISYVGDESARTFSKTNVENMYVHPNPWQCGCLSRFETWMRIRNVAVRDSEQDFAIHWDAKYPKCIESEVDKTKCNSTFDDQFKSVRDDYFKGISYDKFVKDRSEYGQFGY